MSTLVEFLLARIADDESVARDMQDQARLGRPLLELLGGGTGIRRLVDPTHTLAECEAKREVVGLLSDAEQVRAPDMGWHFMKAAVRALALPYADHPDFDESWRD